MSDPAIVPFDANAQWPEPDMTVLRPDRPNAPEMTDAEFAKVFGPWANWLASAAEVKSAHVDYVALALLTTASAIVGNSRWAVPWDGWKKPPVIWGMLIGDPSAGKSPALDAVLDPVKEIDSELSREYLTNRSEWQAKDEVARIVLSQWKGDAKASIAEGGTPPEKPREADAGKPPIRKRVRITDATTEKVAELLATTWRGLLLSRAELGSPVSANRVQLLGHLHRPLECCIRQSLELVSAPVISVEVSDSYSGPAEAALNWSYTTATHLNH
jgi:hypothetical protein